MFEDYLESVGASSVIAERVSKLYGILTSIIPAERVPNAFISNILDDERNLQWKSLWFYGSDYCSEFKDFQWSQSFDGLSMSPVQRWEATLENYDFSSAASDSKLSLNWNQQGVSGELTAVGVNCDFLTQFLRVLILPNELLVKGGAA